MPPDTETTALPGPRHITDADAEAIARALEKRVIERFYKDLGRGVWAMAWRVILAGLIAVAAYGGLKGLK